MKIMISFFLLLSSNFIFSQVQTCGTTALLKQQIERDSTIRLQQENLETFTQNWISNSSIHPRAVITIPVVVHVVWENSSENISEEQILSQILVLNQDFRKSNPDFSDNVPSSFLSVAADTEIEFCLAQKDPTGQVSTGITRTKTELSNIGGNQQIHYSNLGGKDGWPPENYLNIWVGSIGGENGRATAPGTAANPAEDGVVIDPKAFGTTGLAANNQPFHLGRTATHEIGHYLNLQHIWGAGNGGDCSIDDGVADTPRQLTWYTGCPDPQSFTCNSKDMFMNFMDYVDDECMGLFTLGQKARMLATLNGPRQDLVSTDACDSISGISAISQRGFLVYPNPSAGPIYLQWETTPLGQDARYELLGIQGKIWSTGALTATFLQRLTIPQVPAGLYLLRVWEQGRSFSQKIMIQP
ncbi:MAG: M43 family zinc metalloprotease [Saprospiraceae bacterium]